MEPSWTEPPPFAWVFIGTGEGPVWRRQRGVVALGGTKRWGSIIQACKEEHAAQDRAILRSDKGRQ